MRDYKELQRVAWEKHKLIIDFSNKSQIEIFKKEYGRDSENFMTPNIIGYGVINPNKHIVYEVSQGTDFHDDNIFGVTVTDGERRFFEDSRVFWDYDQAMEHIKDLIKKYE